MISKRFLRFLLIVLLKWREVLIPRLRWTPYASNHPWPLYVRGSVSLRQPSFGLSISHTKKRLYLPQQTGRFTASSQKGLSALPNRACWNTRSGAWLKKLQLQTRVELTENDRFFEHLRFVKTTKTHHDGYNRTTSITMKKAVSRNGEPWTKSLSKVEGLQAYNLNWCCIKSAYPLIFLKPVEK